MIPEPIQKFIESFSKLPSIGPRLATKLAFYLLTLGKNELYNLEKSIGDLKMISRCERCFFLSNQNRLCNICSDPKRDRTMIAIIEKETDLMSLERTGRFAGVYFIIGELPERGVLETSQKLRIAHLKEIIARELGGKAKEIIIALNPNTFGDFMAQLISQEFKNLTNKISRLGRGIPTGGEIEFADEETLGQALERRN